MKTRRTAASHTVATSGVPLLVISAVDVIQQVDDAVAVTVLVIVPVKTKDVGWLTRAFNIHYW